MQLPLHINSLARFGNVELIVPNKKLITRRGLLRTIGVAAPALLLHRAEAQFNGCKPGFCNSNISSAPAGPPVTGLVGWYDSSVFSSLTIDVSNFCNNVADLSGSGNDLSRSTSPVSFGSPVYSATGLNSRPTLEFFSTGNGDALACALPFAFGTSDAYTQFFVGTLNNASTNYAMFNCYLATGQANYANNLCWTIPRDATTTRILTGRNATTLSTADLSAYDTPRRVIAVYKSNGTNTLYIDGVAGTPGTGASSTNFGTTGTFMVGNIFSAGIEGLTGNISEMGVCNADNTANVAALDTFLKNKWGL